ncbi:hypothetical protein HBH92_217120 [Parastagonospora nodorum]|nr:hypothetical protein HBI10_081600 [Parastagonospora nodorum]KAH4031857.1 hypothetical protein HBI13_016550 [Parastagonospora nodorum]KAH4075789.1 hypothetical protein HBH50_021640 [Parastagonospora nodorum]KAH4097904.1 hypothetical protein HBH48_025640 [Parastagonospora nodorum]KAH4402047.1 hypothetical protein HBH92_217120 [Parastagonospora nodorum]
MSSTFSTILPSIVQLAYRPVNSVNGEIRLVELALGQNDEPFCFSIHTKQLHETVEYEALSYVWGKDACRRRVLVNGVPLPITENLDRALRRLRYSDRSRMLWIDTLCINQGDMQERSDQVQHMAMIYKSAKEVIIWLGEWTDSNGCPDPEKCRLCILHMYSSDELSLKAPPNTLDICSHPFEHFFEICRLPWFYRVWTIQEFILSTSDPIAQIGSDSVRLSHLLDLVLDIEQLLNFHKEELSSSVYAALEKEVSDVTHKLCALRYLRTNEHSRLFYSCLFTSRIAMATDPRDKIFGLLGICEFRHSEPITASYNKTVQQVFTYATFIAIQERLAFPFFHFALHPPSGVAKIAGMPSWAIDFSLPSRLFALREERYSHLPQEIGYLHEFEMFERRDNIMFRWDPIWSTMSLRVSEDGGTLFTHGRFVGTVAASFQNIAKVKDPWSGWNLEDDWKRIHQFYTTFMRPKNISLVQLIKALSLRLWPDEMEEVMRKELVKSGTPNFSRLNGNDLKQRTLLVTEEGHVGVSYHYDPVGIQANDILVCILGIQVPFVLRPVPDTLTYTIINVAYVPGCGDDILCASKDLGEELGWSDFSYEEGSKEYAIV